MQKPAEQNQIWVYAPDQIQKRTDIKYHGIVMMRMVLAWGMWTPLMTEDPTWGNAPLPPPCNSRIGQIHWYPAPCWNTQNRANTQKQTQVYLIYSGLMMLNRSKITKTSNLKTKTNSNGFKSWAAVRLTTVVGAIWLGSDGFLAVLWSQGFAMPCHWPISFTFYWGGGRVSLFAVL